ncbi:MAG TPA: hypothetical protein VKT77_05375, partial [Chthonomonadaceae bacterium]|nr:hypothetical protein [Chthonomonadaceae bacterium]
MSWTVWRGIKLTAALLLAGIVQAAIAGHVQLWGAAPDVLLTVSIVCAMFCAEGSSAAVGFAAGFIHASLAAPPGAGFGSLVVSRTLVCFGVGCLEDRLYRDSALVAAIVVAAGTAAAEGLFFVFNPSRSVLAWAP